MNILMIAPEQIPLPPLSSGSVETCMFQIAKQLAKRHQVTIISRRHPRFPIQSRLANVKIVRVPAGSPYKYIFSVIRLLRKKRYDWIQIDNRPQYVPVLKKNFPDTPVSIFLHSLTFVTQPKTSVQLAARHLAKADKIVCNSRSLKGELIRLFPQHKSKVHDVLLGVDTNQFRPATLVKRKQLRAKKGLKHTFTIVFVGRLIPRKGLPVLIKAVSIVQKSIPKLQLVIAGKGQKASYVKMLRNLSASLKVPAVFLGRVPRNKIHEVYWLADCFVCPSQGHEAFGLVAVEAMASAVPCIASNNGGLREVIKHNQTGVLVDHYRSPEAFAAAIIRIYKHKQKYRKLGMASRHDVIQHFSWRLTAAKLERLYRRVRT